MSSAALQAATSPGILYSPWIALNGSGTPVTPRWTSAVVSDIPAHADSPERENALLREAIDRLDAAIGRPVFQYAGQGVPAEVVVTYDPALSATPRLGDTALTVRTRLEAGIKRFQLGGQVKLEPGLPQELARKVFLHELGHAAGLEHDAAPYALMNAVTGSRTRSDFNEAELATLRLIYGPPLP